MALSHCNLCDRLLQVEPTLHCPTCDTDDRQRIVLTMGRREELNPPKVESPLFKFRRALPMPDAAASLANPGAPARATFRNE